MAHFDHVTPRSASGADLSPTAIADLWRLLAFVAVLVAGLSLAGRVAPELPETAGEAWHGNVAASATLR